MDSTPLDIIPSYRAGDYASLFRARSSTRIAYSPQDREAMANGQLTVAESGHNSLKPFLMILNHYSLTLS